MSGYEKAIDDDVAEALSHLGSFEDHIEEKEPTNSDQTESSFEIEESEFPVRPLSSRPRGGLLSYVGIALVIASVLGVAIYTQGSDENIAFLKRSFQSQTGPEHISDDPDYFSPEEIVHMTQRLQPKELVFDDHRKLVQHQFLHLHHMKTGGTSMDALIRCATSRLKLMGYTVPYGNLHECSPARYENCLSGKDADCVSMMVNASVVSFCAPLRDLPIFTWIPTPQDISITEESKESLHDSSAEGTSTLHAVTVLRHPVERVWSMYRFKTKFCYNCAPIKEIYEGIANGTFTNKVCASELENHMTRNLIQHEMVGADEDVVEQAVTDIKKFFTVVGLTEDMEGTREIVGRVFPWMADRVEGNDIECILPHANKSPENNRCGPKDTHMELPSHPTPEDAELILQYNQLDMKVYEAGVRHHRLQKIALGLEPYSA